FATKVLDESRFAARPEFRYVSTEHAPHYRRILRCFLEAYEGYYQDELTAEWIFRALSQWDADYTLDRCRDDLDSLCEWGNLAKSLDIGDSRLTLANLASPTTMYRATKEALEVEKFLEELGRRVESEGALRHEDLLLLADSF